MRRVTKDAHVVVVEQIKVPVGKTLSIIFAAAFSMMLLRNSVPMVAEFMHEDVKQHKGPGLGFGKSAADFLIVQVVRNTQTHKHLAVRVEIPVGPADP